MGEYKPLSRARHCNVDQPSLLLERDPSQLNADVVRERELAHIEADEIDLAAGRPRSISDIASYICRKIGEKLPHPTRGPGTSVRYVSAGHRSV
eukprot:3814264-Rhodomonas_salina.1